MSDAFKLLIDEVSQMTDVATSAVAVIDALRGEIAAIRENGVTEEALVALEARLEGSRLSLGTAVAANATGGTA